MLLNLCLLFTTVAANPFLGGGGMGGPFGGAMMRPSFLQTANSTILQEWDSITQGNKTIAQQQQDQQSFGSKYGLAPQIQQWQQNMTQFQNQMSQNLSDIISALAPLKEQFMNILNNKEQTQLAMMQAITALKNSSGTNGEALFAIAMIMMKNNRQNGMSSAMGGGPFGGMGGGMGGGWNAGSGMGGGNLPFSMGGGSFPSVQMPGGMNQNTNNPFSPSGSNFGGFGNGQTFPNQGQNTFGGFGQTQQSSQPILLGPGPMVPFQGKK